MTTNLLWPEWVLVPKDVTPLFAEAKNASGGASPTGSEQIVGSSPGRWRIGYGAINVFTAEHERVFKTIAARIAGRAGAIMVSATVGRRTNPWPLVGGVPHIGKIAAPLTDAILLSDGSAYRTGTYARTIAAVANNGVAAGAASGLVIKVTAGGTLKIGQIFQYGERVAMITEITATGSSGGSPTYTVKFSPPAREAIAMNDVLDFDNPRFRARLAGEEDMGGLELDHWKFGDPSLVFEEDN